MSKQESNLAVIKWPLLFLVIIWGIHLSQVFLGFSYYGWGVYPRHVQGMLGILTSPLIHGDFGHLINNSIPFLVCAIFMLLFYRRIAVKSFFLIYILTGILVWLFARPSFHIGASGVVYGMVAFLFWNGIFRKSVRSIAISLVVFFLYSGMIIGVFPIREGVSWESHLLGAIVGVFVSYLFREEIEEGDRKKKASWELEAPPEERRFLNSDTFDYTLKERQDRDNWNQNSSL